MTTNQLETVRSGDGSLTFHRTVVDGRHVSLNMPGLAHICGHAWSANRSGYPTFFGHTRADLSAYCEREGITLPPLPEEWCPVEWGLWVLDECAARVSVRADGEQSIVIHRDGSWGHTRGRDPWSSRTIESSKALGERGGYKGASAARAYRAYAAEHNLPQPPADWWPEPVEEPAETYSLADDPRLREVVRTKWGEARWEHLLGWSRLMLDGCSIAALYASGEWFAYPGEFGDACGARHGTAANPANAYDEVMAALRDLGSLVDEEPDADTGAVQMQTTRDLLLNLADRMFYSDRSATFYAGELRKLAREMGGGDQ